MNETDAHASSNGRTHTDDVLAFCQSITRFREHTASELGISASELDALGLVCSSAGISPGQLASELEVTSGSVTPIIDHLIQAGYVQRSVHPTDRRRHLVNASPGGRHACASAREELEQVLCPAGEHPSEHEQTVVAGYLAATTQSLRRRLPSADDGPA